MHNKIVYSHLHGKEENETCNAISPIKIFSKKWGFESQVMSRAFWNVPLYFSTSFWIEVSAIQSSDCFRLRDILIPVLFECDGNYQFCHDEILLVLVINLVG
ncbi:MAG: hypothetical protein C4326_10075 [Ignavibacteria bacterium]